MPPTGCQWQSEVLALFDALPRLAALGLKSYRFNARRDGSNVNITGREAFFTEPTTGLPFQYAQMVDFAPMALLRSAFRHVSVWRATASIYVGDSTADHARSSVVALDFVQH